MPFSLKLLLLVAVLSAVWAEASLLTALRERKAPSDPEETLIIFAMVIPLLFIFAEAVYEPSRAVLQEISDPLRPILDWGGKALLVGVVATFPLGLNTPALVAGVILVLIAVAMLFPTGADVVRGIKARGRRKDDD